MTVEEEVAGETDAQLLEVIRDLSPYMSNYESARRDAALVEMRRRAMPKVDREAGLTGLGKILAGRSLCPGCKDGSVHHTCGQEPDAEADPALKAGDIVFLKSGSAPMTVVSAGARGTEGQPAVEVAWFRADVVGVDSYTFPAVCLRRPRDGEMLGEPVPFGSAMLPQVICDRSNNSMESIARGELNVTVRYPPGGTAHQV